MRRMNARHRSRFMARAGCAFALLLLLSAIGITTLIRLAAGDNDWVTVAVPIAIFVVMAVIFATVRRRFGSPMGDIIAAAERVGDGDYSTQIAVRGPVWLRSVSRAFNGMTARLQANEQQRRHMMADIAHELRTPLTVIQGRLEALIDGVYARDDARLQELLDETRVVARLVEDLRTLANAESGALALQKEPTDLDVLIHDAVSSMSAEAERRGVKLQIDEIGDLPLLNIDPLRIREVLVNLLSNAIRHTPPGGSITIRVKQNEAQIEVAVSDTGSGIAAEDLPHIFDRFYKGASSQGSGLGLTIARNLVESHGGSIRATSQAGVGTTITFTLP